jgi:hypothetical protein
MNSHVRITKAGLQSFAWTEEIDDRAAVHIETFVSECRLPCTIDPDVTLLDIFHAVERDASLKSLLSMYSLCDIDAFHCEAEQPLAENEEVPDFDCIRIAKSFKFGADGADADVTVFARRPLDETNYGIYVTPVNQFASLPVRLKPEAEIFNDGQLIGTVPYCFTLLEILGEIYFELSTFGRCPADRDARWAEINAGADGSSPD